MRHEARLGRRQRVAGREGPLAQLTLPLPLALSCAAPLPKKTTIHNIDVKLVLMQEPKYTRAQGDSALAVLKYLS